MAPGESDFDTPDIDGPAAEVEVYLFNRFHLLIVKQLLLFRCLTCCRWFADTLHILLSDIC